MRQTASSLRDTGATPALSAVEGTASPAAARLTELTTVGRMIALRRVPIFAGLSPESLVGLARSARGIAVAPGDVQCMEGETGEEVFVLTGGEAAVLQRGGADDRWVRHIGVGEVVGEVAVLSPAPRTATIRAGTGGARALRLDGASFRAVVRTDPDVADAVIQALTVRFRATLVSDHADSR